jgi:hypothetical protein
MAGSRLPSQSDTLDRKGYSGDFLASGGDAGIPTI